MKSGVGSERLYNSKKESLIKSVCCFRGDRDRLWVDGEEGGNLGEGRKKN